MCHLHTILTNNNKYYIYYIYAKLVLVREVRKRKGEHWASWCESMPALPPVS